MTTRPYLKQGVLRCRPTWWIRKRHSATTCAHQETLPHVQLQDVIRRRSNITATLNAPLACAKFWGGTTVALRWNPGTMENTRGKYIRIHTLTVHQHFMTFLWPWRTFFPIYKDLIILQKCLNRCRKDLMKWEVKDFFNSQRIKFHFFTLIIFRIYITL